MIQEYLNYLSSIKGYSDNTVESYRKDIADFAKWAKIAVPAARWSTITRKEIDRYIREQVANGLMPATTNRRLSAISSLYRYLQRTGYKVENPCRYESRRKIAKTIPNTIPAADIIAAYNNSHGVVKIMIGLLASTGIRIQELLDMTYENIDFKTCAIRIHGKGNKERIVYSADEYLATLRDTRALYHKTGKIFNCEQRTARLMIYAALKPYSSAIQLSPHAIRHTYATNQALAGTNSSTLAKILGHDNIATSQHYIDLAQLDVQKAMQANTIIN